MENQFISSFIIECVSKGISLTNDICNEALKQIEICNEELNKADLLRIKKNNLIAVLKNFNHNSMLRLRGNKTNTNSINIINETSEEQKFLMTKIYSFLEKSSNIKASDVINAFGGYGEQTKIYTAIKSLGSLDIIKRDESGFIIKGEKWNEYLNV